jgi:ComEC/Rec2-related protein
MFYLIMPHFVGFIGAILGILLGKQHHYYVLCIVSIGLALSWNSKRMLIIGTRLGLAFFIIAFVRSDIVDYPHAGEVCNGYITREMLGAQVVRVVKCETAALVDHDIVVKCSGFKCADLYTYRSVVVEKMRDGRIYGRFGESKLIGKEPYIASFWYRLLKVGQRIKGGLYERYLAQSSETVASMAVSIVFGATNVPVEFSNTMKSLGIVHVMAVSGINITYLLSFLSIFINKLGRGAQGSVKLFVLLILNILVGPSVSLLRATITSVQQVLIKVLGFQSDNVGIFLVLSSILIISPRFLTDYSYLLVTAACIGIYIVAPVVTKPIKQSVLREFLVSMVVWLCVLPMQWVLFKNITWYGGVITFLLAPLVEVVTILGYVIAPFTYISSLLAIPYLLLVSIFVGLSKVFHEFSLVL